MAMTKEELMAAFREAKSKEFADVPDEFEYTFSDSFEKRMDVLIKRERRPAWRIISSRRRRIVLIAAILLMLFLTACSIPAVREAIVKFFWNVNTGHSEIVFSDEGKAEAENRMAIKHEYSFSELPDGFVSVDEYRSDTVIVKSYTDASGVLWQFSQTAAGTIGSLTIDNDTSNILKKEVNGIVVYFQTSEENTTAYWMADGYMFELYCYGNTDVDLMISVVELVE